MRDLTITGVQSDLRWQDKVHNLRHFEELLDRSRPKTDLIILPEMFSTGFSMQAELLAENMDGHTVRWMREMAVKYSAAICGSLIIRENDLFYNRFILCQGDDLYTYDKRHLFSLLDEGKHYTPGVRHTMIELHGWKIQPFVCYDLRFPVWCRNTAGADLQIFVANWPERRVAHWVALLACRAIENQCYVAGINRIGNDKNDIYHTGDSGIYGPYGEELAAIHEEESVFTRTLSMDALKKCRDKFPFLEDRDNFTVL